MKFEFIGNACGIFHGSQGTKVLCDPWIVDGVFEGSWFHYPPLKTTMADLQHVDAIYLSHLHPDHYDERHFEFRKDIPIFILDEKYKFLEKKLRAKGYENLAVIPDGHTHAFNEIDVTLFAPFAKHPFFECEIGNVIDSAMVIRDVATGAVAFNANDNTPTIEACQKLKARFGIIDLAMINYNAAGPYPSCFTNLSPNEKKSEHRAILDRNIRYMADLVRELEPKYVLPFAGAYVLGGKEAWKNEFLGTCTWDECAKHLAPLIKQGIVLLRERGVFDLHNLKEMQEYVPIDDSEMGRYIKYIEGYKYDFELDPWPTVAEHKKLHSDLTLASICMRERIKNLGIKTTRSVYVQTAVRFSTPILIGVGELVCSLDPRLLRRILDRKAHWNNAEIGCHIEFSRTPNTYEPDLHTALQFLHL